MDPFRKLLFLNGHPFGSSNTGIAVPASITTDPIADLHDGQAAPMQQGFTTTEEIGHGPIDVHIEKAPTFLFFEHLLSINEPIFSPMHYVFRHDMQSFRA